MPTSHVTLMQHLCGINATVTLRQHLCVTWEQQCDICAT